MYNNPYSDELDFFTLLRVFRKNPPTFCQIRKIQDIFDQFWKAHMVSFCDKHQKSFEEHNFSKKSLFHTALLFKYNCMVPNTHVLFSGIF